ncbi:type II toxin-antitoxin system VapB family antitoxin [Roseococcus sp. YIM B11640]|uniref:type II toxin-antitoxin system VapB family antitoxin n=1 Tax=Roseococcus sp. YIM B11640 TaxID=3133973 RepID=UPI003C7DD90F
MGQLNIKDEELIAKLKRLAERRSSSVVEVLRRMVEQEVLRDEEEIARRLEAIREITRESAKLVPPGVTSDPSYLYDENGLPK